MPSVQTGGGAGRPPRRALSRRALADARRPGRSRRTDPGRPVDRGRTRRHGVRRLPHGPARDRTPRPSPTPTRWCWRAGRPRESWVACVRTSDTAGGRRDRPDHGGRGRAIGSQDFVCRHRSAHSRDSWPNSNASFAGPDRVILSRSRRDRRRMARGDISAGCEHSRRRHRATWLNNAVGDGSPSLAGVIGAAACS